VGSIADGGPFDVVRGSVRAVRTAPSASISENHPGAFSAADCVPATTTEPSDSCAVPRRIQPVGHGRDRGRWHGGVASGDIPDPADGGGRTEKQDAATCRHLRRDYLFTEKIATVYDPFASGRDRSSTSVAGGTVHPVPASARPAE
jgi:hypothetical protein